MRKSERPLRIALRLSDWSDWCRQITRGVQSYSHANPNWQLQIICGPRKTVGEFFDEERNWDGMMTNVLDDTRKIRRILRKGATKIVSFTAALPRVLEGIPRVRVNETRMAEAIGRHLMSGGFRRLIYFSPFPDGGKSNAREEAMRAFAKTAGLPFEVLEPAPGRSTKMHVLVRALMKVERPVGVVTWNMHQARTLTQGLVRAGARIPHEIAIVSWDDDELLGESFEPTLTGAVVPAEQLGFGAAKLLDKLLQGGVSPKEPVLVEPSGLLRIRQSSDVSDVADREVLQANLYIREHARDSFKVTHLLRAIGVSRRRLEASFSRVMGKTLHTAILEAHLAEACRLLTTTDWALERISRESGLGTRRHLHRVFQRFLGSTPEQYRSGLTPSP